MIRHYLLNFFYPPCCAACGIRLPIEEPRRVCGVCLANLERIVEPFCVTCGDPLGRGAADESGRCLRCRKSPPSFGFARSAVRYRPGVDGSQGTIGSIIRRHKYGLDQSLGRALAECVGSTPLFKPGDYDLVIPVPLHPRRLRWRGFNQAAILGAEVARRLDCALDTACLARLRPTPPQTSRDHDARRRNVRGAFHVKHPDRVAKRRILLVDDVMTTGATADECAKTLLAAAARTVNVFTLARVL